MSELNKVASLNMRLMSLTEDTLQALRSLLKEYDRWNINSMLVIDETFQLLMSESRALAA